MTKKKQPEANKASDKLVKWIGSTESLILHTIFFAIMIYLAFSGIGFDKIMLILTTIVSLEAIYLSIFIQMTVNKHGEELEEVSEDIDEIQEDIDEIQEDIEEIQEDTEEEEKEEEKEDQTLERIEENLGKLIEGIIELKKQHEEIKSIRKK